MEYVGERENLHYKKGKFQATFKGNIYYESCHTPCWKYLVSWLNAKDFLCAVIDIITMLKAC